MTKAKLIEYIQELEESRFEVLKEETGLPYNDDEEWVDYIQNLQTLNAERLNEVEHLTELLRVQNLQYQTFVNNSCR
jgi:hypothetical protein